MPDFASELSDKVYRATGSRLVANQWIRRPNPLLDGQPPALAYTTDKGRKVVDRQLAWFAGRPVDEVSTGHRANPRLAEVLSDPMIQLILDRAGAGPEEILSLMQTGPARRAAA